MLLSLEGLDESRLFALLMEQFGAGDGRLDFVPVGEDSWCYRLDDLWVSVRRDLRGHVPDSYRAARLLADSGLDCVLAPLAGLDGEVSHRVDGLPVVVFPYVESVPVDVAVPTRDEIDSIIAQLGKVHRTGVPLDLAAEDFSVPFESDVVEALAAAERKTADAGPFDARMRALLRTHRDTIDVIREEIAVAGRMCAASPEPYVLTHGEPGAPNILRAGDRFLFADWGEAMWGPAERDWFHILRTLGTAPPCRPEFLHFYDLRWQLNEISEYAAIFLSEHVRDAETEAMWKRLMQYLPE